MIRVVLADAHPAVLKQLADRLCREQSICVVGQASTGEEAIASVLSFKPDILVFDPALVDNEMFLDEIKTIKEQDRDLYIIALASYVDTFLNLELRKAGVDSILNKGLKADELIKEIKKVNGGLEFGR